MRTALLFIYFSITAIYCDAQSFINYKDTVNGFSIDIPSNWKYGTRGDVKLVAFSPSKSDTSTKTNFNINIVQTAGENLAKTFADYVESISEAKNFKIIAKGDTTINSIPFKWIIETHSNKYYNMEVIDYNFVAFHKDKTYILTTVSASWAFEELKPLFQRIAGSLRLF